MSCFLLIVEGTTLGATLLLLPWGKLGAAILFVWGIWWGVGSYLASLVLGKYLQAAAFERALNAVPSFHGESSPVAPSRAARYSLLWHLVLLLRVFGELMILLWLFLQDTL